MNLEAIRHLDSVTVFKDGELAGTLSRTPHGAVFTYDNDFREHALETGSFGIAFSLSPERAAHPIQGTNLHPFFANLLPEGLRLQALHRTLKTSADDLFSMLAASGVDTIGDVFVTIHQDTLPEPKQSDSIPSLEDASFEELFQASIISGDYKTRLSDPSVPGAMPKISGAMISFPVSIRQRTKRFILKLGTKEHPQLIENEHFFMGVARETGLDAATTALVHDRDGKTGLLVERFDRFYDRATKKVRKLHQEDACQVLERYPQDKYRLSFSEILRGFERWSTSPLIDFRNAIELYAFNYLVGNGDFHAKNISLLVQNGRIGLAPAYDIVSTLPYGDHSMALKLGAKSSNFTAADFIAFGANLGVPERAVRSSLKKILKGTHAALERLSEIGFDKKSEGFLRSTIRDRHDRLLSN